MNRGLRQWTVEWWAGRGGPAGAALDVALWPAERLFSSAALLRNRAYDRGWLPSERPAIPVVSVGNLSVGGVGKTPFAAWAAERFASWGRSPAIVLRGYGEDEVLVHRELNPGVPVFAATRRAEGVARAAAAGCGVAILDDGFQHRALDRDLDVVLLSAEAWGASRRLLPRGPWRESFSALGRADLIVVTRKSEPAERAVEIAGELRRAAPEASIATCYLAPVGLAPLHPANPALAAVEGGSVLAVASLGDPRAFASQLEMMGAHVELMAFPDHHQFDPTDAQAIRARAGGRAIVMTRKEAVKLRPLLPESVAALVLGQRVVVESGEEALLALLSAVAG